MESHPHQQQRQKSSVSGGRLRRQKSCLKRRNVAGKRTAPTWSWTAPNVCGWSKNPSRRWFLNIFWRNSLQNLKFWPKINFFLQCRNSKNFVSGTSASASSSIRKRWTLTTKRSSRNCATKFEKRTRFSKMWRQNNQNRTQIHSFHLNLLQNRQKQILSRRWRRLGVWQLKKNCFLS